MHRSTRLRRLSPSSSFRAARSFALALLFASLTPAAPASAQRAMQQVLDLNRQAMDAYNNLEIEQAQSLLQQALDAATRGHVTGSPLARTYVNLGIVAIAGMGDNGGGLNYFVQAIQADANVSLDPLLSTPDISLIWTQARARAGSGGTTTTVTPPDPPPSGSGGDLAHAPVPEQLRQTPVPVYLEVPGRPAHVYVYYRGHGMREFQRAEMESMGRGYGFEIPCEDVFEPEVAYYIVAFDSAGSPSGFAGSQSSPITVPIVAVRTTSEPALPGRAPPTQCAGMEEECPPGMPCASEGSAGLGDSCRTDADCSSHNCDDDLCAIGSGIRDGSGSGPAPDTSGESPRFFARLGAYAGVSHVDNGLPTDRTPCEERSLDGEDTPGSIVDCDFVASPQPIPDDPAGPAGDQFNIAGLRNFGYVAPEGGTEDDPCNTVGGGQCTFYVETPGAVVGFALRLDLGYYIIPRWFAVALNVRIQPVSGNGALSFMQLGLRVETQLTDPSPIGFHAHAHVGFVAYGQIQVFLGRSSSPTLDRNAAAPWGQSGQQGIEVGSTIGYRFLPNFGLYLQPTLIFNLPTFLFTGDLGGGIEVGF